MDNNGPHTCGVVAMGQRITVGHRFVAVAGAVALLGSTSLSRAAIRPTVIAAQARECTVEAAELAYDVEELAAFDGINAFRQQNGRSTLTLSTTLTRGAAWKSQAIALTGIADHDDPDRSWLERIADCGYVASTWVGEALAPGAERGSDAVQMLVESSLHRDILLDDQMQVIGLARVRGVLGWYWTVVLGSGVE